MRLSLLMLIGANLLPLIGVYFWGWSLTTLLVVYWLENLIIGILTLIKIAFCLAPVTKKITTCAFFAVHYGGFWLAHGLFLFIALIPAVKENPVIGSRAINTETDLSIGFVLLALFGSHLVSYCVDRLRFGRKALLSPAAYMFLPYPRVFVLHLVIIGGAFLAGKYGSSLFVLALLIALKIIADVISEYASTARYRRNAANGAET